MNVGELKEILDSSESGSGFSFVDLAADKAGIKFVESITRNKQSALLAQSVMHVDLQESDFFPDTKDLVEGVYAKEFERIYGSVEHSNYITIENHIDKRILNLKLHRVIWAAE